MLAISVAITVASVANTANAQTYSGSFASTSLGKVAAGSSATTTFTFSPSGAVTATQVAGGGGTFLSQTSSNARFDLKYDCSPGAGAAHKCPTAIIVYVTAPTGTGGTTGAFGNISNLTYAMVSGAATGSGVYGNGIYVDVTPNATTHGAELYIGGSVPVSANPSGGLTGSATATATATVVNTSYKTLTGPSSATLSGTVVRPLSMIQNAALNFGTIVRPVSGSGTVQLFPTNGAFSVTSPVVALSSPAPTRGSFTIQGEGGQALSVSVPFNLTMTNGSGGSIAVSLTNNGSGSQSLSNSIGSVGTFSFYVGGGFTVSSTTPAGSYTGVYTISAQYN